MNEPNWLNLGEVLGLHEKAIKYFGGASGTRDEGLLQSALARAQNHFAYGSGDLFDMAAAYADGIVNNHPFVDGNKRTGFITAVLFLETNGYRFFATQAEATVMTRGLAAGDLAVDQYARWLRDNAEIA